MYIEVASECVFCILYTNITQTQTHIGAENDEIQYNQYVASLYSNQKTTYEKIKEAEGHNNGYDRLKREYKTLKSLKLSDENIMTRLLDLSCIILK